MKLQLRLVLIPLGLLLGFWVLFLELQRRPGLFANTKYLGAILALEVVLACLWRFDKVFFPVTMGCFLLAGTSLPLAGESTTVRWLFLGVGGVVGLVIWMNANRSRHFGLFHLVALFCVLAALASASASSVPQTALLKVVSLFLLFLYASTGGRVALGGQEASFLRGLVLACEVLVYISAACYLALSYDLFGNYNALGAIIGVGATPVLLWAALVAESRGERRRRYIALALCGALLYVSVCRAAILADTFVIIVLTIALRRPRLLLKAAFIGALFLEGMAVANPAHMSAFVGSLTERLVFKGEGINLILACSDRARHPGKRPSPPSNITLILEPASEPPILGTTNLTGKETRSPTKARIVNTATVIWRSSNTWDCWAFCLSWCCWFC